MTVPPPLVLASASTTRAALLRSVGLVFGVDVAAIDEAEVKQALRAEEVDAGRAAETLAELKARRVAARHAGALVVGADQILAAGRRWFDKPIDRADAHAQIAVLAGATHELVSAVVVVRDGARLWHHVKRARLTMRPLEPETIERYLDQVGETALHSPGAYQVEGPGLQLFSNVAGDHSGILGLPLLPLLGFLRGHGIGLP
ncbi:MAG: septum formation protein Maf [Alphaproteobacteria bacterium]|nr:septum formation protein Maf [Alphaproteobacteria bacterium]